jgi:hypothetical protein
MVDLVDHQVIVEQVVVEELQQLDKIINLVIVVVMVEQELQTQLQDLLHHTLVVEVVEHVSLKVELVVVVVQVVAEMQLKVEQQQLQELPTLVVAVEVVVKLHKLQQQVVQVL